MAILKTAENSEALAERDYSAKKPESPTTNESARLSGRATDRADFSTVAEAVAKTLPEEDYRIRPAELARALEAIEKREHTVFLGTLSVKKTLDELQIKATPEEIWAEVKSARDNRKQLRKSGTISRKDLMAIGAGVGAMAAIVFAVHSVLGTIADEKKTGVSRETSEKQYEPQRGPSAPPAPPIPQSSVPFFIQTATTKRLGDFKDGEPFMMTLSEAQQLNQTVYGGNGVAPISRELASNIMVDAAAKSDRFQIVRYNDKFYLRGYTTEKFTVEPGKVPLPKVDPGTGQMLTGTRRLFSSYIRASFPQTVTIQPPPPSFPPGTSLRDIARKPGQPMMTKTVDRGPCNIPVTIPVDGIGGAMPGQGDGKGWIYDLEINKLDQHAWEKWKEMPVSAKKP